MSKWKIVDVNPSVLDLYAGLLSFGLGREKYVVEHEDTGEQRIVYAEDEADLGEKISRGEFEEPEAGAVPQEESPPSNDDSTTSHFNSESSASYYASSSPAPSTLEDAPSVGHVLLLLLLVGIVGSIFLNTYGLDKAKRNFEANFASRMPSPVEQTAFDSAIPASPSGLPAGPTSLPKFRASAIASSKTIKVGDVVTFTAEATGGNGYYSFYWTGTDNLNSLYQTISKRYAKPGLKRAVMEVTSNHETLTAEVSVKVLPR